MPASRRGDGASVSPVRFGRRLAITTGFWVGHTALSAVAILLDFTRGMVRFETGAPASALDTIVHGVTTVLLSPVMTGTMWLCPRCNPGNPLGQYAMLGLNSAVWTAVILLLVASWRRRVPLAAHDA